jgi:hypothetical protein
LESYEKWASRLRLAYSQRKKSVRRMKGSGGSAWPTATAMQTRDGWGEDDLNAARAKAKAKANNGNGFGLGLGAAASSWPTARAEDAESSGIRHSRGVADTLTAVTSLWKTPSAQEPGVSGSRLVNADGTPWTGGERAYDQITGRLAQTGLGQMIDNWPTPMAGTPAQNGNSAAGNSDFSRKAEELAAKLWKTPDVPNGGRALKPGTSATGKRPDGSKAQVGLENQAKLWTTPQAHDVTQRGSGQTPTAKAGNACLARDATTWPTPAARDHKGENSPDHLSNGTGRLHLDQLPNAVAFLFSRPDPETCPHGVQSSDPRLTWRRLRRLVISTHGRATWKRMAASGGKRRLNPNFVAWLQGWPIGHPSCACSATEFTHWQRLMRGALSALPMAYAPWIWEPMPEAPQPAQADLFGG